MIAAQLNVARILKGSVRKDSNQVRITAQLIDARSDTHLKAVINLVVMLRAANDP